MRNAELLWHLRHQQIDKLVMEGANYGYLDSDYLMVVSKKVFGNVRGLQLEGERAFFSHEYRGIPLVELPEENVAGPFNRQPGVAEKVAAASRQQRLGVLEVFRPMWEPLVERTEEKVQRQPLAPKESYSEKEYTVLDMLTDYIGLKRTIPLVLDHIRHISDRGTADELVHRAVAFRPQIIRPQDIQHLAKIRRDLLQLCGPRNRVMELPEMEYIPVSHFWMNVEGDITDSEDQQRTETNTRKRGRPRKTIASRRTRARR